MHADDNRRRFVPGGLSAASVVSGARMLAASFESAAYRPAVISGTPRSDRSRRQRQHLYAAHVNSVPEVWQRRGVLGHVAAPDQNQQLWCASRTLELR